MTKDDDRNGLEAQERWLQPQRFEPGNASKEKGQAMTDPKRMSDERLDELRGSSDLRANLSETSVDELLAEIDALRAALSSATRVEDGDVGLAIQYLRTRATGGDVADTVEDIAAADLLTRLSTRVQEAERERDSAEADAEGRNYKAFRDMRRRAEDAEAKLATAREAALEEAATLADRCYINMTWPSTVRVDVDGKSLLIAHAIRTLSPAPDTGKDATEEQQP